uniref:Mitochondrial ribosomal protein L27 n=1 Tax=Seriola lalandi dorsalis TaxID=1841481 RepID=A0A3B4XBD4_SERLL
MAALVSLMLKPRAGLLAPGQSFLLDSVRFASKKSGGSCKNVGKKDPGRRYGFKKQDGNSYFVQSVGVGVGLGTNRNLFALEDGYVRFTKEVFIPPPRSRKSSRIIPRLPQGAVLYKTFINIVPLKQEGKFKLMDMV